MNTTDEQAIREQLERAVAPLDPTAPALDTLRARAAGRRKLRYSLGAGLTAATAGIVAVALVVVPGGGSKSVEVGKAPSSESLAAYVTAHHGKHAAGPMESGTGYFGAYSTKNSVEVVKYVDNAWQPGGSVHRVGGSGEYILKLSPAGAVIPGHASFYERDKGGNVTYFGGVVYEDNGTWTDAKFARCPNRKLSCWYRGTGQPYGAVSHGEFVSFHNDCTPYCAAGTNYKITWRWDDASSRFVVKHSKVVTF